MKSKIIIGCDISKNKLDFFCGYTQEYFTLSNNQPGLIKLLQWLKQHAFDLNEIYFSMEHTGYYGFRLAEFLFEHSIKYFMIPALQIKRSMGITRGKSDKIDARRIYDYTTEKFEKLNPTKPTDEGLKQLKRLSTHRALMVNQRASLLTTYREQQQTLGLAKNDFILIQLNKQIKLYDKLIKETETKIEAVVEKTNELSKSKQLLESIIGVGKVISISMIIATENFTRFTNWRKFASYCSCAPFPNESGTKVRPARISKLGNKKIKSYLSQGALSAIQHDAELRQYYQRKLADGKDEGKVLNVIKCKLLARMFSVINRGCPFQKDYNNNLVVSTS